MQNKDGSPRTRGAHGHQGHGQLTENQESTLRTRSAQRKNKDCSPRPRKLTQNKDNTPRKRGAHKDQGQFTENKEDSQTARTGIQEKGVLTKDSS